MSVHSQVGGLRSVRCAAQQASLKYEVHDKLPEPCPWMRCIAFLARFGTSIRFVGAPSVSIEAVSPARHTPATKSF